MIFSPRRAAVAVLFVSFATIAGAWAFEYAGYLPCELCLQQRWAYYLGVPVAALALASVMAGKTAAGKTAAGKTAAEAAAERLSLLPRLLFVLVGLIFIGSAVFGAYHAGVEWGFWPGPTGCTGAIPQSAADMNDFMKQLQTTRVVRCDAVALRILGLSLAGWNAVISAALAALALHTAARS